MEELCSLALDRVNDRAWTLYMAWVWASWPCAIALGAVHVLAHFEIAPVMTQSAIVRAVLTFMSLGVVVALIAIEDRACKRGRLDLGFWGRIANEIEYSASKAMAKAKAGLY